MYRGRRVLLARVMRRPSFLPVAAAASAVVWGAVCVVHYANWAPSTAEASLRVRAISRIVCVMSVAANKILLRGLRRVPHRERVHCHRRAAERAIPERAAERSAAQRHVGAVTDCFCETPEDPSLHWFSPNLLWFRRNDFVISDTIMLLSYIIDQR